ncbi:MAG: restriction endonuclease subunit S [Planctomycetes bacterium]|nr:restriction endonuclease subunit S [Planctomycetota bacterium]
MRSKWQWLPLGDVCSAILDRRGVTPKKLGSDFTDCGHRVISAKLIKEGRLDFTAAEPRFVDAATYIKWMKEPLRAGDVLVTSEAPLGERAYLPTDNDWVLGQRLFALRGKQGLLHGRFLYYVVRHPKVWNDIQARASGTTVMGIRQEQLRKVELPIPPLPEQQGIAAVLGALDDKIELNRRMNRTLEEMAQALFKSWFVDFDGHDPDDLVASELGLIPKGRVVGSPIDCILLNPTLRLQRGSVATYVEMKALSEHSSAIRYSERRAFKGGAKFMQGDTLLARITPCLENGKTAFVDVLKPGEVAFGSTEFIVMRGRDGVPAEWVYCLARSEEFRRHAIANMTGSSGRQRVPESCIERFPIVVPRPERLASFGAVAAPLFRRIASNNEESLTLAGLRDTLLPKLISGEIRVPEAEEKLEAAL